MLTLGTGGVSMFALRLAKASGARVIVASSSDILRIFPNQMRYRMRGLWICSMVASAACSTYGEPAVSLEGRDPLESAEVSERRAKKGTLVIAVRHAEKGTDDPVDPSLSVIGQARAEALAGVLEHAKITTIYTSQFRRTQQTAAPLSLATGVTVDVRPIDASNIATYSADLANEIRAARHAEAVLVVGHSNTIPDLVRELSGVTVPPISEPEHSRVFTITLGDEVRLVSTQY